MSNENAKRDENQVPVLLGLNNSDSVSTEEFRVDPVTDRLLIDVTLIADHAAPTLPATLPRDDNHVAVRGGVTDDGSLSPSPFIIDTATGLLFVDLVSE